ncbi:MAG: hypothetical protein DI539_09470 [Flavobacterium psychrophilum]|nr:MAG: hypothetical protein DI539_09470 [Flavobacterium psychrophilum]
MDDRYYNEVGKYQILKQADVIAELEKYNAGDLKALNRIVEGNLRLVVYIAKKYSKIIKDNDTIDINDLIGEGNLGLMVAIQKYDPSLISFASFATLHIRKKVIDCILDFQKTIRSPQNKGKSDSKIRKKIQEMEQELLREITFDDLQELNIYKDEDIKHYFNSPTTSPIPEYYDIMDEPEEDEDINKDKMLLALRYLKGKEYKVITEAFGINTDVKTLTAIGKELGITRERVRQIKVAALNKLKAITGVKTDPQPK